MLVALRFRMNKRRQWMRWRERKREAGGRARGSLYPTYFAVDGWTRCITPVMKSRDSVQVFEGKRRGNQR
jgi:hypothetical protein